MINADNRRIEYIDITKGIAILFVVLGHIYARDCGVGQYVYSFHIPIFYIISGILIFHNSDWRLGLSVCVVKRIKKLLYPYATFSILSILIDLCIYSTSHLRSDIFHTITLDGIYALWFLPALFISSITAIFLLQKIRNRFYLTMVVAALIILTSYVSKSLCIQAAVFSNRVEQIFNVEINLLNRALIGTIFILIGYFYAYVESRYKLSVILCIILIISSFILNFLLYSLNYVDLHYSIIGNPILYYINAISGSYFYINMSKYLVGKLRIIPFFGKNSLTILATHLNFYIVAIAGILANRIFEKCEDMFTFIFTIAIEIIVIYIINKFCPIMISYERFKEKFC